MANSKAVFPSQVAVRINLLCSFVGGTGRTVVLGEQAGRQVAALPAGPKEYRLAWPGPHVIITQE